MIILAMFAILLLCTLILLLRICIQRSEKVKKCYNSLYTSMFHRTWIRFVLLSSLKMQIDFCGSLAIGVMIEPTLQKPEKETTFKVLALCLVIALWLFPALFSLILYRNRANLDHRAVKEKIGALYENFRSDRPQVATYPIVYLFRRCIFVLVTYLLRPHPALQIHFMLLMTLVHLCYINCMPFYDSRAQLRIEMINECFLLAICYHFLFFLDYTEIKEKMKKILGESAIGFVIGFLAFNSVLILMANVQFIYMKIKRWCIKRSHQTKLREKEREKEKNSCKACEARHQIEVKAKLPVDSIG